MRVALNLEAEDLARSLVMELSQEDTANFICEVDLQIADVRFTEDLIKRLVASVVRDYSTESQFDDLLNELRKVRA